MASSTTTTAATAATVEEEGMKQKQKRYPSFFHLQHCITASSVKDCKIIICPYDILYVDIFCRYFNKVDLSEYISNKVFYVDILKCFM